MTASVHEGCVLSVLPGLPDGSIGHVVTDPPFGMSNERYESQVAFDPAVWRECYRVCSPGSALLCFAGSATYHRIACAIEAGGWKVRQTWAWVYADGLITSAYPREGFDRLAPAMTPICFATRGKVLLRLERDGAPWDVRFAQSRQTDGYSERAANRTRRKTSGVGRWPRSVVCTDGTDGFQYFALSHNATNRDGGTSHPNEKPLPLMRWLCGKLPPGRILDPFAGSGTTLEAALLEGHPSAVGIERDPAYCLIARDRLARTRGDVTPPGAVRPAGYRQASLF